VLAFAIVLNAEWSYVAEAKTEVSRRRDAKRRSRPARSASVRSTVVGDTGDDHRASKEPREDSTSAPGSTTNAAAPAAALVRPAEEIDPTPTNGDQLCANRFVAQAIPIVAALMHE
jgi:hypothetical protein